MNMLVSSAALATASPAEAMDQRLDDLWLERESIIRRQAHLDRQLTAAKASLPSWAQDGPDRLNFEGEKTGWAQWPELADLPDRSSGPGVVSNIRPSLEDLREHYQLNVSVFAPRPKSPVRKQLRADFRRQVRNWIARRREQLQLRERAGLAQLYGQCDDLVDRLLEIESQIFECPPSIDQAIAILIIRAGYESLSGVTLEEPGEGFAIALAGIESLSGFASGSVKAAIDRIFANPTTTLEELGVLPC